LRYRVGGPLIDGLMKELGMSGGSLDGLLAGAAEPVPKGADKGNDGGPAIPFQSASPQIGSRAAE
jgi:hypothetical protein